MKRINIWLHRPPMAMLVVMAVVLGVMPAGMEPHLIQKLRMLMHGALNRPVDIFDLFWHSWPLIWIALRLITPAVSDVVEKE